MANVKKRHLTPKSLNAKNKENKMTSIIKFRAKLYMKRQFETTINGKDE